MNVFRFAGFMLLACFLACPFASPAHAEDTPGMRDFSMGMSKAEVESILKTKYNMVFGHSSFSPRFAPTNENPYGSLQPGAFMTPTYPGLEIKGCNAARGMSPGWMSFVFANDTLIQAHVQITDVENKDLLDALQGLYGGKVSRLGTSLRSTWYIGGNDEYQVFMETRERGTNNVVIYSAKNADDTIRALMDAHARAQDAAQQEKLGAVGKKL